MTKKELIDEIIRQVLIASAETVETMKAPNKTAVIDLNSVDCVCDEKAEKIYIKNISVDALVEIALGTTTNASTKFIRQKLLHGEKLYTSEKEIELYNYKQTASKAYFAQFNGYVEFLKASGLVIVSDIADICCCETTCACESSTEQKCEQPKAKNTASATFEKRVLTEKTITSLNLEEGIGEIIVGKKTLVTDLAKDYAKKHNIKITTN